MAYFPIIPVACISLIFSKIAFTVFALCQIVNPFRAAVSSGAQDQEAFGVESALDYLLG
jgi:hypothetical protein